MKLVTILFSTFLVGLSVTSFAQKSTPRHTISGYIYEKGSKETLIGATVYFTELKQGTQTNNYGFYSITLPEQQDSVTMTISFIGYTPVVQTVKLDRNYNLSFHMENSVTLNEVVVNGSKVNIARETQMSAIEIPIQQLKNIPQLMGEKDIIKALQLLPGVQKGTEGQAGLYVRGGGPDQNLIILDDAPVYNANHLFGFFSTFNGDAIKNVTLYKGGFPARFGGRLSSVVDITMKDGNKQELHGEGGIGLIASRLTLEVPIKKGKSSFLISGRRTYLDVLTWPIQKAIQASEDLDGFLAGYYFYDLNAKFNHEFDERNHFYLSGYFGQDRFYARFEDGEYKDDAALFWGNLTGTARWNHRFTGNLFGNLSFIASDYTFGVKNEYKNNADFYSLRYNSGIRDYSLKWDFDYRPNTRHTIKTGALSIAHRFTPEAFAYKNSYGEQEVDKKNIIYSFEGGVFVEDDWQATSRLNISGGLRLSIFKAGKVFALNPESRIATRYLLKEDLSWKAAYADMNQYLHLLSNSMPGLPTDLWVPATEKIKPQHSRQIATGLAKDFLDKGLQVTLEGYYKTMNNIITYKEGASFLDSGDPLDPNKDRLQSFEDKVTNGKGTSYGAELFVKYEKDKFFGWIGYTLSKTMFQFDSVNLGKSYPAKYDRTHDISVVGTYKFNERTQLTVTWIYGTGNAITLQEANANFSFIDSRKENKFYYNEPAIYGDKNGFRMGAYHRLDIGLQRTKKTRWGERTWEFSIYNAYARANPFFYYITEERNMYGESTGNTVLKQIALFPLVPSITYSFKF